MKFATFAAATLSLFTAIASAFNTIDFPLEGSVIEAGKPCQIKWEADTPGPVRVILRKGPRKNLGTVGQIVMLEKNFGIYNWDVPANTPAGKDYALEINWGETPGPDDVNYTGIFEITGGSGSSKEQKMSASSSAAPSSTGKSAPSGKAAPSSASPAASSGTSMPYPSTNSTSASGSSGSSSPTKSSPTKAPSKTGAVSTGAPHAQSSATKFTASACIVAVVVVAAAAFFH